MVPQSGESGGLMRPTAAWQRAACAAAGAHMLARWAPAVGEMLLGVNGPGGKWPRYSVIGSDFPGEAFLNKGCRPPPRFRTTKGITSDVTTLFLYS